MRFPLVAAIASVMLLSPAFAVAQTAEVPGASAAATGETGAPTGLAEGEVIEGGEAATTAAATAPTDRVIVSPESLDLEIGQIDLEALTEEEELPFFVMDGYYRIRANWVHETALGFRDFDTQRYFQHRARFEPRFNLNEKVVFKAQIDTLDDQIWGGNPGNVLTQSTADRSANIIVKRAWFDATLPFGILSAGRMPSQWGMGLLSNDGNGFRNIFGDAHGGSTFDRVQFGTKPLGVDSNWIVAVLYDRIVSDQPASLVAPTNTGSVNEWVGVLFFNTDPLKFGVYQLYRFQNETDTRLNGTDGYFKLDLGLLYAETEHVFLYGNTKAVPVLSQATFTTSNPEVGIDQYGYAARIGLNIDPYAFEFEWGNATGDRNGFNDVDKDSGRPEPEVSNYKFHPDYNVGLIMFEYAAAIRAQDDLLAQLGSLNTLLEQGLIAQETINELGQVAELALTNGSVTNAFYINPKVRYSLLDGRITSTLAYLYATANAPRVIRTQGGRERFSSYGHEFDVAVDFQYTKNFVFGIQAGYLFAGDYFNRQDFITSRVIEADDAALVQGRFTILF